MAEWQTRQTQNLLMATLCGFKSRYLHIRSAPSRNKKSAGKLAYQADFLFLEGGQVAKQL